MNRINRIMFIQCPTLLQLYYKEHLCETYEYIHTTLITHKVWVDVYLRSLHKTDIPENLSCT